MINFSPEAIANDLALVKSWIEKLNIVGIEGRILALEDRLIALEQRLEPVWKEFETALAGQGSATQPGQPAASMQSSGVIAGENVGVHSSQ